MLRACFSGGEDSLGPPIACPGSPDIAIQAGLAIGSPRRQATAFTSTTVRSRSAPSRIITLRLATAHRWATEVYPRRHAPNRNRDSRVHRSSGQQGGEQRRQRAERLAPVADRILVLRGHL